jgi:hypothetical protein
MRSEDLFQWDNYYPNQYQPLIGIIIIPIKGCFGSKSSSRRSEKRFRGREKSGWHPGRAVETAPVCRPPCRGATFRGWTWIGTPPGGQDATAGRAPRLGHSTLSPRPSRSCGQRRAASIASASAAAGRGAGARTASLAPRSKAEAQMTPRPATVLERGARHVGILNHPETPASAASAAKWHRRVKVSPSVA